MLAAHEDCRAKFQILFYRLCLLKKTKQQQHKKTTLSSLLAAGGGWPGGSGSPKPCLIAPNPEIKNSCHFSSTDSTQYVKAHWLGSSPLSLNLSLFQVPPVFVLKSLQYFKPLPWEAKLISSRERVAESSGFFICMQMEACSYSGLTGSEAEAYGWHDS